MTTTTYAADRTALLIGDPYNDFMSEGGKMRPPPSTKKACTRRTRSMDRASRTPF
jgi:hypothetical protein